MVVIRGFLFWADIVSGGHRGLFHRGQTEAFALHAQVDQLCLLFIFDLVEFDLILALG